MFPVKIYLAEEDGLSADTTKMREWLDHRRCEPMTFRYTFEPLGIAIQVVFIAEAEALAFAEAFAGIVH